MPAPVVTRRAPPPFTYPAATVRPQAVVTWTGGVGPFTVSHQWDTDPGFASGALITVAGGATSPSSAVPSANLGPPGTTWFYRARVTDTSDAAVGTSSTATLEWFDPLDAARHLYAELNAGVGFDPTDTPGAGWGPAPGSEAPDGLTIDQVRHLYALANAGVGFDPTDTPGAGWGPAPGSAPADGFTVEFDRFLYVLANIDTTTPTPHIWFLYPTFGREGWEFTIIGYGFGDTQGTYSGSVTLNGLVVGVISWALVAQSNADLEITPLANVAHPIHQVIAAEVPAGATSGDVVVCTDGP